MGHPVLYTVLGFTVLVLGSGAAFFLMRPDASTSIETWSSSGALFPWSESETLPENGMPDFAKEDTAAPDLGVVPLPPLESMHGTSFDELADLLSQLIQPAKSTTSDPEDFIPSSYAFIPQGLISLPSERPRTPEVQALYAYGNSLGLSLKTFADLHPDMPQTLKDQAEDRSNPVKAAALKRLGADFVALAGEIEGIDPVPPSMSGIHSQLAAAYRDAGEKLAKIPDASGDEAFLASIYTYNTSSETLSLRLIDVVDHFQSKSVTFSPNDPGSAFTFSANSSF